ncbi:methyltransferase domain-containing protein [Orrella daihaiensis]|uniref:Methyltransferase domain-containing protein n=1 Tax=Orrella daihaiensis TaxID=2782176 RepID=A0ABY4AK24_9BURK|nr:methyltransferase domain-containing protein [Orrella daihaiensis]UOD50639.1 methyltransferase domain-containing protein [Orrella daihaiensis]
MTNSSHLERLAIEPRHVKQQFDRRGDLECAEFLYGEIAARMLDRLALIRLEPTVILDAGCGAGRRFAALRQRYPQATILGLDHNQRLLTLARQALKESIWQRFLGSMGRKPAIELINAELDRTQLAPESIDLIWSNLAMHWHPEPHHVLREWSRLLRPNGLAFFTVWGPATGKELREAITAAGLQTATLPLVDMHDLGDLMVEHGFADPVMDQETITLTYDHAGALLADAYALGGNPNPQRKASLASRVWREHLIDALESKRQANKLTLTLEIAYGHAWRNSIRRQGNETRISVQAIGRKSD